MQTAIRRKRKGVNSVKRPWGKFLVFALVAPLVASVYFIAPHYANTLHLAIGALAVCELFFQLVRTKAPAKHMVLFLLTLILVAINFYMAVDQNPESLISLYFTVVIFDSYSQLTGQLLGKRKLFPSISPYKTVGGLAFGGLVSFTASFVLGQMSELYVLTPVQVLIVIVLAFCGDTTASMVKRKLNIKDFSQLVPYQGGVLDRFDSYLFACLAFPIFSLLHINI
ncbi:MAG: phosphatidate cytidylyltransferase [Bacteroidia bacterium]|nr:phosphatidate cytidylyltransferase [Bacteroidia bacterium]